MLCVGVLGAGHLGKIHLKLLKELENVALVGFFDHNPEVTAQIANELGINAFLSADDLIDACDAIDIVLSVVKSSVKSINASGVAVVSDSPDIANARLEFDNGCVANLTASRISLKNMRKSRFFQRDAYIAVDFLKKKTDIVRLKNL